MPEEDLARNRLLNCRRDVEVPKYRFNCNWILHVPVGKDKWLAGGAGPMYNFYDSNTVCITMTTEPSSVPP